MEEKKVTNFTSPILVVLLVIAAFLLGTMWTKNRNLVQQVGNPSEEGKQITQAPSPTVPEQPANLTLGNFSITEEEVCKENDKPIIYFFGGNFCPHCRWEHPIVERVAKRFGNQISFHNNMDKQNVDTEILTKFNNDQGYVPFLVFGCKYIRVGSGENLGETVEEKNLTAIICKLTGGKPEKVCAEVKDLTGQIKESP